MTSPRRAERVDAVARNLALAGWRQTGPARRSAAASEGGGGGRTWSVTMARVGLRTYRVTGAKMGE